MSSLTGSPSIDALTRPVSPRAGRLRATHDSAGALLRAGSLLLASFATASLLWVFYDRYWWPVDEGIFANIAERLLAGEVLNLQVQTLHPGYINFVHAAAFAVFGIDLVSLRYPLILITFVQALLVWRLLAGRSVILALAASVAMTAFGVVHFLNPTPHWYCLFLTVTLVCWLEWVPTTEERRRTIGAGILLGIITAFRLLTGIWVASALLVILLRERADGARGRDALLGRAAVTLLLVLLVVYVAVNGDAEATGILALALGPAAILVRTLRDLRASNAACLRVGTSLVAGMVIALAPLLAYHIAHGSVGPWIRDVLFMSAAAAHQPRYESGSFAVLPVGGLLQLFSFDSMTAIANGVYWIILPLAPLVGAVLTLRGMRTQRVQILPVMAVFYALVTLHLAGAVYLYFSVGLIVASILWQASFSTRRHVVWGGAALTAALAVVALVFHAGQSSRRTTLEQARGDRTVTAATPMCGAFFRSSLRVTRNECEPYRELVAAIQAQTPDGGEIAALPNDAELYFLSDRKNAFRFVNSLFGIQTTSDLDQTLELLKGHQPLVVAYRPDDTYNTPASHQIMEYVRSTYDRFDTIAGVELYRLRERHDPEVH